MTSHLPRALRVSRRAPATPRRAESAHLTDAFPRPAASPGATGFVRVPRTLFTGVPRS
jgi:hypothetical protein